VPAIAHWPAVSYTVLARKYRPQSFGDLVGQEHVSRTLANAITSGRVAHAFLFTGARGVGKTTTARLVAKALNCEQGPTPEPCNVCDPCKEITVGTDVDVLEIDGASNNSVEDVRKLQESLPYRPVRDRHKIVIVDEVHMLSTGAFNAFLKTLEEPPPHVKFIFATTEIHKVPITIRSRCQRHDFRLIPHAMVAARVRDILAREQIAADDEAVAIVVREAQGSLRDALTVLDQLLAFGGEALRGDEVARGLGIAQRGSVLQVARALLSGEPAQCVHAVHALGEQGLDVLHFARQLLWVLRDLIVLRVVGDDERLVDRPEDERSELMAIAKQHDAAQLERAFGGLAPLVDEVAQSATPQLALEMGLVRLADRPPLQPIAELLSRLASLEERLAKGGGPPSRGPSGPGPRGPSGSGPSRPLPESPAPRELRSPTTRALSESPSPPPSREPVRAVAAIATAPAAALAEPPRVEPAPLRAEAAPLRAEAADTETSHVGLIDAPRPDSGDGAVPDAWHAILRALSDQQPGLYAVLVHGVPVQVDAERVRVSFPQGSFFGRQASSDAARAALSDVATRLLGTRPVVEVGYDLRSARATVAAEDQKQKDERREKTKERAMRHPRVQEALAVFPEAEGNVEVQLEDS
jgi:DNA polymerase-3 subunit gamma/tau